ncbi:hypothetical protein Ancab_001492 [Ancistrocladus abbreviatus]
MEAGGSKTGKAAIGGGTRRDDEGRQTGLRAEQTGDSAVLLSAECERSLRVLRADLLLLRESFCGVGCGSAFCGRRL